METETSPISASLGALSSLPRKRDELLATGHWSLRGIVMDEIERLATDLHILHSFMLKLSNAQDPPMSARHWMKDVRELSYDVEDCADQFVQAHGHGRAKIHTTTCHKIISRVKINRLLPRRRKWRPWIINKVLELRTRAHEATRRYWRYKFDDCACASNHGCSRMSRELPAILPDPDDLVGIQGPVNELEQWLINGELQLKVVSIVGVGGIGKTTLAQKLWCKLRGQFECGAFVRTAQKPDMRGILRNMLLQLRPHQPSNPGEMRYLINEVKEYLQDKRYLVIVDDLWATSVWDVVSRAFPQNNCCSRIITTTEIMGVALACCFHPEHVFEMESLSDNDSEKLLLQRILVSGNQSAQQFDDVIPQIMRICGGLPLAIIIVARILASQPEKLEQLGSAQNSSDSILGANNTMEGSMGQILNICFISLPHYLKTCLLYLSTYPEGCPFFKEDLVKQWVAEGFICANDGEDMEETARSYFDELVNMGLIQVMDVNYNYELLSYSIHQLVLDLITYKSIEENFITVVNYSQTTIPLTDKVRRLSLHFGSAAYATTPASTRLSQVRSLFYYGLFNCMPSFVLFKLLRVLILNFWGDTRTTRFNLTGICELLWLRYLQVTCNVTVDLPDKIEAMKHLETLEINAKVSDVPPDIVRLSSLLHLRLRGANLPNGIGCIRSLRTIMYFDLGNTSEDNLWGLGELTNLWDLHLTYSTSPSSEHLKRNLIALASSVGKLCNLKSLTLAPDNSETVVLFDGSSGMSTPISLERLELLPPIWTFSRLPKWIAQLHKICIVKVAVRELMSNDIAILAGLPCLTVLSLSVQTSPEGRTFFNDRAFPVLKYFKFRSGVLCMSFRAGAMPNLRRLKLGFNTHIGENYANMLAGIEHLLQLQDISGQIGATTESDWRAAESAINGAINKHPRNPRCNLQWVDPLKEECHPLEKHHEKGSFVEKHGVLEKANDMNKHAAGGSVPPFQKKMNKHADIGLSQFLTLPSTVASGQLKSGSLLEESKESPAPSLPWKASSHVQVKYADGELENLVSERGGAGAEEGGEQENQSVKLFVGQVPKHMMEAELAAMFKEVAVVDEVIVIRDRATKASRGCCFLICPSRDEADKAINAYHNKHTLLGAPSPLQIKYAYGELERLEHKIFIGMIPKNVTDTELTDLFSKYGNIKDLQILRGSQQTSKVGCAFIKYETKEQAVAAIDYLNGKHKIEGSSAPLVVKWADTEKERRARKAQLQLPNMPKRHPMPQSSVFGTSQMGYSYQPAGRYGFMQYPLSPMHNQASFHNMLRFNQGNSIQAFNPVLSPNSGPSSFSPMHLGSPYPVVPGMQYPQSYPRGPMYYRPFVNPDNSFRVASANANSAHRPGNNDGGQTQTEVFIAESVEI